MLSNQQASDIAIVVFIHANATISQLFNRLEVSEKIFFFEKDI